MKYHLPPRLSWSNPRVSLGLKILGLATAIYITGKPGQQLATVPDNLMILWLSSGIGLAAVLLWGYRVWPGLWLGGWLVNLWPIFGSVGSLTSFLAGLGIASGLTLQALVGAFLITRLAQGRETINSTRSIIIFTIIVGGTCLINCTAAITSLSLAGLITWQDYVRSCYTWWLGNMSGVLLITPFILVWSKPFQLQWQVGRITEALAVIGSIVAVGYIVFSTTAPVGFIYFPIILWSMLRFGQRCTTLALVFMTQMIIWNTSQHAGLFGRLNLNNALVLMEAFTATFIVTALIGLAFIIERKQAQKEIADYYQTLEQKIAERTQELAQVTQVAEEARAAAENANRSKSQFLTNMSHELRTPLNAIIGYSEMLQEEATEIEQPTMVADLQKIAGSGKHLLHLVNDILDLSKIEAGKMEIFLEDFEVTKLVESVVTTVEPLLSKKSNQLKLQLAPGLGEMQSDETKVRQTLLNLLSNAAKFTDHGTIGLAVSQLTTIQGDFVSFSISDTGIGMTTKQLGRLFEAFNQGDNSTSRNYGGTGLGLVISRHFCRMLGGDITVESSPGQGSTFTFNLPLRVSGPLEVATATPAVSLVGVASTKG